MKIFDLPTPALIADDVVITENMNSMAGLLRGKRALLRPHYKSHKCSALAHRQMDLGAVGMTCAKLSEAEDLVFSGISDVLIANQVVEPAKIYRLALLAKICRLTVCVDSAENARQLSQAAVHVGSTIHCLVEYDIGMKRCGVRSAEEYLDVAEAVVRLPHLAYDGIQAYAGHASHMEDVTEREKLTRENERKVSQLKDMLRGNGIEVKTVSGGSTGTCVLKAEGGVYTELQAGSYLWLDSTYDQLDLPFKNALYVLATVISKSEDTIILDVGVKGLGADQNDPVVLDPEGNRVTGRYELNEEHLKLYDSTLRAEAGDKLLIIPGHCCSTVNLYDRIYLFSGETITDRIIVTARGNQGGQGMVP